MDDKEKNENNGVKYVEEETKCIHIQHHKSNNTYTEHNDK